MTLRSWRAASREPRWRVLAGAFVTIVLAQGLSNSFPVFLLPLSDELGGLRSLPAAVFSVHNVVLGLVGTVVDVLMQRVGERVVMLVGAVVLGGGIALASTSASPLRLFLWFGVVAGLGAGLLGSVAQLVILTRWFPTARGTLGDGARHLPDGPAGGVADLPSRLALGDGQPGNRGRTAARAGGGAVASYGRARAAP